MILPLGPNGKLEVRMLRLPVCGPAETFKRVRVIVESPESRIPLESRSNMSRFETHKSKVHIISFLTNG